MMRRYFLIIRQKLESTLKNQKRRYYFGLFMSWCVFFYLGQITYRGHPKAYIASRGLSYYNESELVLESIRMLELNLETRKKFSDATGRFMYQTHVWSSTISSQPADFHACLATHCTVDKLFWLTYQANFFGGPISVSVFTPGKDIEIAVRMIRYLQVCHPSIKEFVDFHILYPTPNQPDYDKDSIGIQTEFKCEDAEEYNNRLLVYRRSLDMETIIQYPQNIARNLGWIGCRSKHVLNLDVDMVPNYMLYQELEPFFNRVGVCKKCAYILPVYEIKNDDDFPVKTKRTLLHLLAHEEAQRYHILVYDKNQKNSNLGAWEKYPKNRNLKVMYNIPKYGERWEPIMMLHQSAPKFLEQFIGYGSTRNSHTFLLNFEKYRFKVLDQAFVTHKGFQTKKDYPQFRTDQIKENKKLYIEYKEALEKSLAFKKRGKNKSLEEKLEERIQAEKDAQKAKAAAQAAADAVKAPAWKSKSTGTGGGSEKSGWKSEKSSGGGSPDGWKSEKSTSWKSKTSGDPDKEKPPGGWKSEKTSGWKSDGTGKSSWKKSNKTKTEPEPE